MEGPENFSFLPQEEGAGRRDPRPAPPLPSVGQRLQPQPRGQPGRGEGRRSGEPFTQHPNSAWSSMVLSHYRLSHLSPRRAVSQ